MSSLAVGVCHTVTFTISDGRRSGSSRGRAPRCASWFLEHVRENVGDADMQIMVLEGGIKGWVQGGAQCIQFMDGFDEAYWRRVLTQDESHQQESNGQAAAAGEEDPAGTIAQGEQQSSKRPLSTYQDNDREKRVQW